MFGGGACSHSVGNKVRCMDALVGDKERARFLVGTTSLQQPNAIHVLEYDSIGNEIKVQHVYDHPAQVVNLAPSPFRRELVMTCGKMKGEAPVATLWKMEDLDSSVEESAENASESKPLVAVAELPAQKLPVTKVVWNVNEENSSDTLASAHGTLLRTWSLENDMFVAQEKLEPDLSLGGASTIHALAWDPHHPQYLSYTLGGAIQTWDIRAKDVAFAISVAHVPTVLDIDYNPNKPYCLVSGGDNGKMKFWDVRHARKPLLALTAHTHWVWSVRYNRFHDQLVLSSSSDSTVALWRVSSISSAPIVELAEQDLMNDTAAAADVVDTKIKTYEQHEDSVYSTAWAVSDSWLFASISYDGRFAVNQVPSTEKYKILL